MKKLLLCLCLAGPLSALAAPPNEGKNLSATDTEVVRLGDGSVSVSFKLEAGSEVTPRNRSLIVRPSLAGGGSAVELPPIVIRGSRAREAAESVAMTSAGIRPEGRFMSANGAITEYRASVPWQEWMVGARLELSGLNAGPGNITEVTIGTVADNLFLDQSYIAQADALRMIPPRREPVERTAAAQSVAAPVYAPPVPVKEIPTPVLPPVEPAPQPAMPPVTPPAPAQNVVQRPLAPDAVQRPSTSEVVQRPLAPEPVQRPSTPEVVQRPPAPEAAAWQERGTVVQRPLPSATAPRDYSPEKGYYEGPERLHRTGTIGDELAARFTFVEPVARFNRARGKSDMEVAFDYNMPLVFGTATVQEESEASRFVEMTREGAVYFRFERGSSVMTRDLGENNTMYVDLISSIQLLIASPTTRITNIVVVGFSSPEGPLDEKETLAMDRAGVARDFLTANSRVDPSLISIYNGSVDWVTLRALVAASNMPEKYKVLEIIDNAPAWNAARRNSRLGRLMTLNDGEVFNYMRRNFFPQMRQTGAYVKVYYENVIR